MSASVDVAGASLGGFAALAVSNTSRARRQRAGGIAIAIIISRFIIFVLQSKGFFYERKNCHTRQTWIIFTKFTLSHRLNLLLLGEAVGLRPINIIIDGQNL